MVILITGGKDDGNATYNSAHDPATTAAQFLTVTGGGVTRRVPIHVIGIKPAAADESELQGIATASGGHYSRATNAAAVAAAINYAAQSGFARSADFDLSQATEYLPVSPIVGTVNSRTPGTRTATACPTPTSCRGSVALPQRSNVLITAGTRPGPDGRIRLSRLQARCRLTKPTGWKFVNDGTALWPDPSAVRRHGLARPADPSAATFTPTSERVRRRLGGGVHHGECRLCRRTGVGTNT